MDDIPLNTIVKVRDHEQLGRLADYVQDADAMRYYVVFQDGSDAEFEVWDVEILPVRLVVQPVQSTILEAA